MTLLRFSSVGVLCLFWFFLTPCAESDASPPAAEINQAEYQPEHQQDPYLPGPAQLRTPGMESTPRAPAGSVQVNVNGAGMNIVGDAANEPSIAVDPTNPQRMAIGWRQFDNIASNFRQGGYAYTTNGGASWTFPGVLEPGVFRSDPVLAADNAGRFFYNSLQQTFCMDVWQSSNAGATWPVKVAAFGGDKQWMDVDRTGGIGAGNLYSAWQFAAVCTGSNLFTRSTDHGNTWMTPIAVTNSPRFGVTAVGPDGAVYVTGTSPSSTSTAIVAKSTNAQNPGVTPTWTFSVTGNFLAGSQRISAGPNPAGLLGQVWIAANPTNASHVYLLCSVDPTGTDPLDVRFARSIDGGQTWLTSVRVNDDPTTNGAWQWFGTMSVAPNGRIDVVWNDTRDDPANALSRLYYSNSVDEGVTWSPNVALTPQWNSQLGFPQQNKIGDYYQMISDNDGANLAYAATFNGEQDVYFMRICPGAPAAPTSASVDRNNFCADDSGNIALTAVGGSGGTVHWFDDTCGGHDIGTGSPLSLASPTQTTTYYVRREAPPCTPSACASVAVTVNPNPAAATNPTATPPTICGGQSSTLSATVGGGQTAVWYTGSCGGTIVPGGSSPTVSPTMTTTYCALAQNTTSGCKSTSCVSVTVSVDAPATPGSPAASPPIICVGQSSSLSATAGSGETVDWFEDSCGGTPVPGGDNPTVNPTTTTTYNARARNTTTKCTSSTCATASVTVIAPTAPTGPTAVPPAICVGQSSTLSATAGAGETVDWFEGSCGGTLVPGGASPTVSPTVTTTYHAQARNTTAGCTSPSCSSVTVTLADHTGDFDGGGVSDTDLQPFVDTLVNKGSPEDCIADMNNDGVVDGLDIPLWIAAYLGP